MKYIFQNLKLKKLYIFFLFLAALNIFFSTGISLAKTFSINDVKLSTPFKVNFNKNKIIDEGFVQAFNQLMLSTVQSKDCLLYTSPSPRDRIRSRMPSSA